MIMIPFDENNSYLKCQTCGHYILDVIVNENGNSLYADEQERCYGSGTLESDELFVLVRKEVVNRRISVISKYINNDNNVLEVGPGGGDLLKYLGSRGVVVDAVEESEVLASLLQKEVDANIINCEFELCEFGEKKYDALISFHVIEHVVNVLSFLKKTNALVRKGGLIFIATPNASGWENNLPFALSPNFDMAHINLFSQTSLLKCLKDAGWDIVEIATPEYSTSWLRVFTKILRRIKNENEAETQGKYVQALGVNTDLLRFLLSLFRITSFVPRKLQEKMLKGNELFVIGRKK